MPKDLHQETQKRYQQILDALEELNALYAEEEGEEKEEEEGEVVEQDIVDLMAEEAAERGLDEDSTEKVFRAVSAFVKKAKEG